MLLRYTTSIAAGAAGTANDPAGHIVSGNGPDDRSCRTGSPRYTTGATQSLGAHGRSSGTVDQRRRPHAARARIVDGAPVETRGVTTVIEFRLED